MEADSELSKVTSQEFLGRGLEREIANFNGVSISLPETPWMPTHAGVEIRVGDPTSSSLVLENKNTVDSQELLKIGRVAVVSAEVAEIFAEAGDPNHPDWYDKPWFNLNFNSHLGLSKVKNFMAQVYLRARTMGQMRSLKPKREYTDESDKWSNPYWTPPIPVDYPLNPFDRRPYDKDLQTTVTNDIAEHFSEKLTEEKLSKVRLFREDDGSSSLIENFEFRINEGNYPVWQIGDYLIVTQDNPLVDREDGLHLVVIFRGEQQGEGERFSFHWRDPRRIAEMAIIAVAASKIITNSGYAGNAFDKAYIHFNANWSLGFALPAEEQHEIMDRGSVGPGKWPGSKEDQTVPGPNAHPHIQLLKEGHEFNLPVSGKRHSQKPRNRQNDDEIHELKELLNNHLTPLINVLQGKNLFE